MAALLTLTLTIAANVTVFSLVNGLLLRPMPFGDRTDRVVTLHSTHQQQAVDLDNAFLSYADMLDVGRQAQSFEQVGGYMVRNVTIASEADAERLLGFSSAARSPSTIGRARWWA